MGMYLWEVCLDRFDQIYFFPVLPPGLKLEYFHVHNWEDEWIKTAENLVHEE